MLRSLINKWLLPFLGLIFISNFSYAQTTDLFFSEYVEGSSNNKYLEIYNGTGVAVNLSDYQIMLFSNGSATPNITNTLSGTLNNLSTIVYQNSSAVVYTGAATNATAVGFNGDDAVALYKISSGSYVDIIGNIGCDPGSAWTSGSNTTANKTLVRNSGVCGGVTVDPGNSPCDFPTLGTEWTVYNQDDVSHLGSHTCVCAGGCLNIEPTTNASSYVFSNISCNAFYLDWTQPVDADGSLVVVKAGSDVTTDPVDGTTYTANTTFGSGTDIGTSEFVVYSGATTGTWITGLTGGTTYYINVFAYTGSGGCIDYRTSDEVSQSQATTSCSTAPHMTTALINGCDATSTCSEGDQEILFLNSGDYTVSTSAADITVNYASTSPPTITYADSFTSVPSALSYMSSQAGCSGVFIDATTVSYVPANSMMLMVNSSICSDAFDWSSLCASVTGNVYVFFSSDATWTSSGQFSNSPSVASPRYFLTTMAGQTVNYEYTSLPSGDGAYATWGPTGGLASGSGTNGCALPTAVLPIELISFTGFASEKNNELTWQTSTEINNDYFIVEKSIDGYEFVEIGQVSAAGTSQSIRNYDFDDMHPELLTYYRLKQVDFNGDFAYSNTIVIKRKSTSNADVYNTGNQLIIRVKNTTPTFVEIVNVTGQVVYTKEMVQNLTLPIDQFISGIYFVRIRNEFSMETYKVKL